MTDGLEVSLNIAAMVLGSASGRRRGGCGKRMRSEIPDEDDPPMRRALWR